MDPIIPWFSPRYSPVTPRKFKLILHVSQPLGFTVRSEGRVDATTSMTAKKHQSTGFVCNVVSGSGSAIRC
jgi:hypothetical protein